MKSTLDGYPDKPNSLTSKVVKRYKLTAGKDGLIYTDVPYSSGDEYPGPAAGLFSTIDDLADYTNALDDNRLITEKEYDKMTAPRGERIPYGFGWMTQRYLGNKLNWAYGEGAFDAALFLRVPEKRLTFIFLSNSGIPSHAPRLYAGNVIRSPFALAFLRHFVLPNTSEAPAVDYSGNFNAIRMAFTSAGIQRSAIDYEELCNQALIRGYMRLNLNVHTIEPEQLIKLLYEVHPSSFDGGDIPLMCLFGIMDDSELRDAASRLIRSFDFSSDHRPEVLYPVGKYYIKIGDYADAAKYFRIFADQPGFVTDSAKIDACLVLGRYYLKQGLVEEGRDYIWRSAQLAHEAHYQDGYLTGILEELDKN
jgi:tetratricopeptide (TPR) repeat protein